MNTLSLKKLLFDNIDNELIHYKHGFNIKKISSYYSSIKFGFHAKIKNNKLYIIKDFGSFQSRNKNTISMLKNVLEKYTLPDTEFLVNTDDKLKYDVQNYPIFTMAKKKLQTYVTYPDHTFYNWSEAKTNKWNVERNNIINNCKKYKKKIHKILFRGASTHYVREYLAKQHNSHLDIKLLDITQKNPINFVKLKDHCKWKYLLHIPGISYAARLKYLMMTNSVVFYIRKDDNYEYREFWYGILRHMYNCIVIKDNNQYNNKNQIQKVNGRWDDSANKYIVRQIIDYINILEKDSSLYNKIVNTNNTFREQFTYELILEYWYRLLLQYTKYKK